MLCLRLIGLCLNLVIMRFRRARLKLVWFRMGRLRRVLCYGVDVVLVRVRVRRLVWRWVSRLVWVVLWLGFGCRRLIVSGLWLVRWRGRVLTCLLFVRLGV